MSPAEHIFRRSFQKHEDSMAISRKQLSYALEIMARFTVTILFVFALISCTGDTTVRTENGWISGVTENEIQVFRGIPYAAPPVGDLRWKPPQPVDNWQGTYRAEEFSPACMQIPPPEGSFYQVEFFPEPEPLSEDCLYLNIWTKSHSQNEQKPIMVWIHGGGFSQGSGSMPTFDGTAFARKGVVLVTLNYRLGIFGLFAHPQLSSETEYRSSGNYGLLDQVQALTWIKQNIAAFGGDPDNITLFGQSSGAGNINKLMVSPMAEGLFHRAILQSGSAYTFGLSAWLEDMEQRGTAFTEQMEVESVQKLREWPADTLLERSKGFPLSPGIDGWLVPEEPQAVFARGGQHPVSLMAGSVADEGNTLFGPKLNADIFKNMIGNSYGEDAERFLDLYPHNTDAEARESFNKAWRDNMAWGAHTLAGVHSATAGTDAYLYYFNQTPPGRNPDRYGAFHSSEIAYLFQSLDAVDRPWTSTDRDLANIMSEYWVNFATTGDPNGTRLPAWPAYNTTDRVVLELKERIETRQILDKKILDFYDSRLAGF